MLAVMANFTTIRAARDDGAIIIIDAAMGTELESRGVPMDNNAWCGLANLTHPELVQAIHEDHIRAGADVIITNTYMSGLGPMARAGQAEWFEPGLRSAVRVARAAADAADRPVAVAGSASVTEWAVPPGDDPDSLRQGYARQLDLLAEAGVDLIVLEMVLDTHRGQPALDAARATGLPVWLGLSTCTPGRATADEELLPEIDETREVATALVASDLDAVCIMHTDIDDVAPALEMLSPLWDGAIGVYPHRGRWLKPHWGFEDVDPDYLIAQAADWVSHGASMIGGCCGLSTRHVQALRAAVNAHTLVRR
ncbi:MAG: homocysteine S-methyltransferase family protein [Solirubrobacteraceae bacterium]